MASFDSPAISRSYSSALRSSELFPDPFADMASLAMPKTIQSAHRFCEAIWMGQGTYRQAMERVISYFITEIEFNDPEAGREEKEKFKEVLEDRVGIYNVLREVASDFQCYGNSFTTVLHPFTRYLMCRGKRNDGSPCGLERPLRIIGVDPNFHFRWSDFKFCATCPGCGYSGDWLKTDRKADAEGQLKIKRWSPHEIDLRWDHITEDVDIIWRIPEDYRQRVIRGELFTLERAPQEIIDAVRHSNNLCLNKDNVFHMKNTALAGIRNRGWGLSQLLVNFRQAWYVQVLHRYNEAIALDYVIPFRLITPAPRSGGSMESSDPLMSLNMGDFSSQVHGMLRQHRRDPASYHTLPFPVEYQALGGEASQMAPFELIKLGRDDLLNASGVPAELYSGTLSVQAMPAALRLFESHWRPLVHNMNRFVDWLVTQLAAKFSWEPVTARMMRVTHADDLNRQVEKLQLMTGGMISRTSGFKAVGSDFKEETLLKLEDSQFEAEETQKMQERLENSGAQQQMGQQPPPGAAPPQGAAPGQPAPQGGAAPPQGAAGQFSAAQPIDPKVPMSLEELSTKADQIAQQFMGMPEAQKDSELINLKKQNPNLHSLVKARMGEIKQRAETAGGAQLISEQFGKTGGVPIRGALLGRRRRLML